jgi:hypothetical protein
MTSELREPAPGQQFERAPMSIWRFLERAWRAALRMTLRLAS